VMARRYVSCTRRLRGPSDAGFSLIAVMVAAGLGLIVAVLLSKVTSDGFRGAKSVGLRADLDSIRQTVRDRLDCRATLGVTGVTVLPLSCAGFANVTLKRRGGAAITSTGKLGDWTVSGGCAGNRLLIRASWPGKDPLSGGNRDDIPTNGTGAKVSTDLFGGISDFCREYFDPGMTCAGAYPLYTGFSSNGATCCRRTATSYQNIFLAAAPFNLNSAKAVCNPGEYVKFGGARCNVDDGGVYLTNYATQEDGFLQNASIDFTTQSVYSDCSGHTYGAKDAVAAAYAICCPKN
jgi:hypothetical protein